MFNLGLSEIVLISIIALIFIGPKQLPEIARALGKALNELKRASEDLTSSIANPKNFTTKLDPKEQIKDLDLNEQQQENHDHTDHDHRVLSSEFKEQTVTESSDIKDETEDLQSNRKNSSDNKKVDS